MQTLFQHDGGMTERSHKKAPVLSAGAFWPFIRMQRALTVAVMASSTMAMPPAMTVAALSIAAAMTTVVVRWWQHATRQSQCHDGREP